MALDPGPANDDIAERTRTLRSLNLIALIAIADALLLAVLLYASLSDDEGLVHVLGPTHGFGFIVLIGLCVRGVVEERWDWWFPGLVVVTLGPPGSLIGDWVLRRKLATRVTG